MHCTFSDEEGEAWRYLIIIHIVSKQRMLLKHGGPTEVCCLFYKICCPHPAFAAHVGFVFLSWGLHW